VLLLFASREMITAYADQEGITWREDQSNSTLKYSRNLIRHQVIPELKKINPNIEFTFAQSSEKLISTNQLFQKVIGDQKSSLFEIKDGHKVILKSRLKEVDEPVIILYEILKDFGFNFPQVKDIINSIDHQPGAVFLSDQYQLTLDRAYLFIEKAEEKSEDEQTIEQDLPGLNFGKNHFSFDVVKVTDTSISSDRNIAMLDFEKLHFPLKIRYWEHGDAFYPLGMEHKKKVSDFMIDEKIPVNLKKQTSVIFSGDDLVWLVGWRIDNRFKITKHTKKILRIKRNIQK
jgi:tRNA(Ile)-lysidine synthase